LQGAKGNSIGFVEPPPGCLAILVSRDQLPRALRVADNLLKTFAERGWAVAIAREGTLVHADEMPSTRSIRMPSALRWTSTWEHR
jgi:hypothetical protein